MVTDTMTFRGTDLEHTAVADESSVFCWAKYGTEAGESISSILARKEAERTANGGVFLWGIGNSIRPSLEVLTRCVPQPEVRFSAMKSAPALRDVSPSHLAFWNAGIGLQGEEFPLPSGSVVTSRVVLGVSRPHFALVCFSEGPLEERSVDEIVAGQLRNYRSGTRVGASQVTSVVNEDKSRAATGPRYTRGFAARLVYPYFVNLTVSSVVPSDQISGPSPFSRLLEIRQSLFA